MPVNTKDHTNTRAAEYQQLMHNRDYALTLAIEYRNKREPDLARAYYNAAQHYETKARSL